MPGRKLPASLFFYPHVRHKEVRATPVCFVLMTALWLVMTTSPYWRTVVSRNSMDSYVAEPDAITCRTSALVSALTARVHVDQVVGEQLFQSGFVRV